MGQSLAKARKDLRNRDLSEVTITGLEEIAKICTKFCRFFANKPKPHVPFTHTGCRYDGKAWAQFCKHFSTALHLHKLNVIGHHHKQEYQMSTAGARVLCNALIHLMIFVL